jgi:hypothetical protein
VEEVGTKVASESSLGPWILVAAYGPAGATTTGHLAWWTTHLQARLRKPLPLLRDSVHANYAQRAPGGTSAIGAVDLGPFRIRQTR